MTRGVLRLMVGCAVVLVLGGILGCEDDADMKGVTTYFDENPYDSEDREREQAAELVIDPITAVLNTDGDTKVFEGYGGKKPYVWSVQDISRGSIVTEGGNQAVYQRSAAGDNIVRLADQSGKVMFATVSQP